MSGEKGDAHANVTDDQHAEDHTELHHTAGHDPHRIMQPDQQNKVSITRRGSHRHRKEQALHQTRGGSLALAQDGSRFAVECHAHSV